ANHLQVADGGARPAHAPRQPLALDHARGVRARPDRARVAGHRVSVAAGAAREPVPLHDALEAAALRFAGDLHPITRLEQLDRELLADLVGLAVVDAELPHDAWRRLEARRLGVPQLRAARALLLLEVPADLDRPVAVALLGADQDHGARAGLDDGDGHLHTLVIEDPRHADLPADQSGHLRISLRQSTLISTSTPAGRSSFVNASIVCERLSTMSISRLCVRSSTCSRLCLSMCGERSTVQRCRRVGSGMGPRTVAPVFWAVRTISAAVWSTTQWSNALSLILIRSAIVLWSGWGGDGACPRSCSAVRQQVRRLPLSCR